MTDTSETKRKGRPFDKKLDMLDLITRLDDPNEDQLVIASLLQAACLSALNNNFCMLLQMEANKQQQGRGLLAPGDLLRSS